MKANKKKLWKFSGDDDTAFGRVSSIPKTKRNGGSMGRTKAWKPTCHGSMLYEASFPTVDAPTHIVYRCLSDSCRGQAMVEIGSSRTTYRREGTFYEAKVQDEAQT